MRANLKGLYVIIDPALAGGRDEVEIARAAIAGGARLIQLRDKQREKGLQLPVARELAQVCARAGVVFIVNDHADLALAAEAGGVHLGQKDLPVAVVRSLVPAKMIVGCSANSLQEALQAQVDGADYISVGRLFPTASKKDTRPASTETIRAVKAAVRLPLCAIGGINESNIDEVLAAGADMAAVISAVVAAPDVEAAAQRLAGRFER